MALMLEVTKADGTVARTPLQSEATKVAAWPGGKVRIIDSETGKAPANLTAKRMGDSLVVENLPEGKTVEITSFYTDCSPATPCSLTIDPADGTAATTITQSTTPIAALGENQALMYGGTSNAAPVAAGGMSPGVLLGGAALAGLALAGGGGGGGGGSGGNGGGGPPPPLDTTAPDAPTLTLTAGSDSGTPGDGITNDDTPTLRVALNGTGATAPVAGDTVKVYSGTAQVGTATLSAADITAGFVEITTDPLGADGAKTLTATVTDAAGNESTPSAALAITLDTSPPPDTTAPDAPTLTLTAGSDSGTPGDGITNDDTPTLRVDLNGAGATAPVAGDAVKVYSGATQVGTATLSAADITAGFVEITTDPLGADGAKTLTATVTDAAGNESTPSANLEVTIDTTVTQPTDVIAGPFGSVSGKADAGDVVTMGALSTVADAGGNFEFATGSLASGTTASVTATDANGNVSAGVSVSASAYAIVSGTAGADTLIGGSGVQLIEGGDGNDVLVGDAGGSVRNYQFDYWQKGATGISYESIGSGTGTGDDTYDYDLVRFLSGAQNGWTIGTAPETLTAGSGGTTVTQTTGGAMQVVNNSVSYSFPDDTGGGGRFFWDSVGADGAAGATISQQVVTQSGEQYTLSLQVTKDDYPTTPGFTENSSFQVWWNGALLATWDGVAETWSGTAPVVTDLSTTRQNWTWSVTADADSTSLELRGYSEVGAINSHYGIRVDHVTLDATATSGDDTLVGGVGADLLFGQGGDDVLYGGDVGDSTATADGASDTFVYSLRADNGNDVIKDFEVGVDRIVLVDAIDTYHGTTLIFNQATNPHGSRDVGHEGNPSVNGNVQTANGDYNLTYLDFVQDNSPTQYLTVTDDGSGSVKLGFWGESTTGVATSLGSVVLEGVAYGAGEGQYDSVQDLFGSGFTDPGLGTPGITVLYATMDGFHNGLLPLPV